MTKSRELKSLLETRAKSDTDLNDKTGVVLGLKNDRFAVRVKASDCVVLVHASNLDALD